MNISTAIAVEKDKNSQFAVKWAIDKLKIKDKQIILVHVINQSNDLKYVPKEGREPTQSETKELFLPYRSFCARKGIRAKEVILQEADVAKALSEYISIKSITTIVLGASSRGALIRAFKSADVPTSVAKYVPDSCSVYVVSKAKVLKLKSGTETETPRSSSSSPVRRSLFSFSPTENTNNSSSSQSNYAFDSWKSSVSEISSLDGGNQPRRSSDSTKNNIPVYYSSSNMSTKDYHQTPQKERSYASKSSSSQNSVSSEEFIQNNTKYSRLHNFTSTSYGSIYDSNYSASGETKDKTSETIGNQSDSVSGSSNPSEAMSFPSDVSYEVVDHHQISNTSMSSTSSQTAEIEDELRRLKQELLQMTMKYNVANQEASTARDKVRGLVQFKLDEESRLGEARNAHEAALASIEHEKMMCMAAVEVAHKAQRIAELEMEKRKTAEKKYKQESEEKQKAIYALTRSEVRYRKYTIQEIEIATDHFLEANKIGEGGYGPVYKATLDHTPVAIKVLKSDISQGDKQFQNEVEILSLMRHPHMVVLLGACPEYGSLVYEYMENGSLEDRLYCKDSTTPLPWQARFRIAAEIATALNFLHRTKPEPLVHRDLKPANILLDRNYVSKISDVGLCRLVPPSIADTITQYHMTAAAGTFCYIDPEYQQTGMLGTKSDVYSFGVMLLQIITGRPPMGLTHHVETAIEEGEFAEILDPTVKDWPVEEAMSLAKLALQCCELRRRDRPDLDSVILPELQRLRELGAQNMHEGRF